MISMNHNSLLTPRTAVGQSVYIIYRCAHAGYCGGRACVSGPRKAMAGAALNGEHSEKLSENSYLRVPSGGFAVYGAARVDVFGLLNQNEKPKLNH
jgi:hypothetical protein